LFDEAFAAMEIWVANDFLNRHGFSTYNEINILMSNVRSDYARFLRQFLTIMSMLLAAYLSAVLALLLLPNAFTQLQSNSIIVEVNNSTFVEMHIERSMQLYAGTSPSNLKAFESAVQFLSPLVF
jgi:hypothetical protein